MTVLPADTAAVSTAVAEIVARLFEVAATRPDRPAVHGADATMTFRELWRAGQAKAATTSPRRAGAVVPVLARPNGTTLATVLGVWLTGGIPLPLPAATRPRDIDLAVRDAPFRALHTCQPWRAHLDTGHGDRRLIVTGGRPPVPGPVNDALGLTGDGTAVICAPLHLAAVFDVTVRQLLAGGAVALKPNCGPDEWLATVAATHATWALLTPAQIARLVNHQHQPPPAVLASATRSLRRVVVPAPTTHLDALTGFAATTDIPVVTWYHAPLYDGARSDLTGTTLTPLPGVRLRTVDPTGRPTRRGAPGLIEAATTDTTAHPLRWPCTPPANWRTVGDLGVHRTDGTLTQVCVTPPNHYLDTGNRRHHIDSLHRALAATIGVHAATAHTVPDADGIPRAHARAWVTDPTLNAATLARACTDAGTPIPTTNLHLVTPDRSP